jgi:hypothetical protein
MVRLGEVRGLVFTLAVTPSLIGLGIAFACAWGFVRPVPGDARRAAAGGDRAARDLTVVICPAG